MQPGPLGTTLLACGDSELAVATAGHQPRLLVMNRAGRLTMPITKMSARPPTADEVRAWPVTVDVRTAGRAFGIGRDQSYRLAREGRFPVPVLRLGRYLRVTRAAVLEALGIEDSPTQDNAPEASEHVSDAPTTVPVRHT